NYIEAEVMVPGVLKENKGVNIPGVKLDFKGITAKDRIDLEFGLRNRIDFVAQSFVRTRRDIECIRRFIGREGEECRIIAKIENGEGVGNIDSILDAADGIMIARGDLGVSLPIYQVPMIQKMIIKKCNRRKKMVITATQMLESMTEHIRPTRAEVSDVTNAILDGSGYLMLSAETAAGAHPDLAVKMMNDIIKFTERFNA
ncbi:MAG: pyruvate kinase, partial [Candidatus Omnitrophica bacterium]|nr:pyruvate kinase [Candidatus Omnitrophota bacterium]